MSSETITVQVSQLPHTADSVASKQETLLDFLAGYIGVAEGTGEAFSEDCGRRFAEGQRQ